MDALSYAYSASHHNRIDTRILFSRAVWTGPPDGRSYTSTGLIAGLNLSLAMIQEDYVIAGVGQELLSGKLGQA